MKRISVLLSIAAFLAISAPLTAQSNGGKYGRAGSNSGVRATERSAPSTARTPPWSAWPNACPARPGA